MQPLRNELLQLALQHYQRFLTERGADRTLLEEIARTHYRVATIQQAIEPEALAAQQSLEEALRIQRELLGRGQASEPLQEAASDTLNAFGLVRLRSGAGDLALPLLDESRQLREQLVAGQPERIEFRRKLASTIMNIGLLHKQLGRFEMSLQAQEAAQASRRAALKGRSIAAANAEERLLWRDVAMGHYNRANLAVAMERADAAETELQAGIDVLEQLARTTPNDLRVRERLAANYHFAARLRHDRRDPTGATKRYEQALAALEELHRQNPQVVEFQERLALVQLDFGTFQARRRDSAAAQTAFQRACDLLAPIVPSPDSAEQAQRRRNYAVALRELARTQLDRQQPAEAAESSLKLSQEYLEGLIEQASDAAAKKRYEADLEQTRQVRQKLSDC
jgi:tetratricopeptide (TPR) repeat protein